MSGALQFSSGRQLGAAFVRVRPETSGFGANLAKQLHQAFKATSFDSALNLSSIGEGVQLSDAALKSARIGGHIERAARFSGILASNILRAFGAPIALGAALVGKIRADFEATLNTVRAVSGATYEQAEALEAAARASALGTKFTAQQVAEAQQFLAMAGNDVGEILASLPSTLSLAAAGNLELGQAADIVTNVMAGQGRTVDQLAASVDVLTATFTSSNTNLSQLGTAFSFVGPVAATIGVQFEETAAAIGLLGNAGIQASRAGTTLRGALSKLVAPTRIGSKILKELGVVTTDTSGAMLPLADIIEQFEEKSLTAGQAMRIFGLRAGPGMLALVGQGSNALRQFTKELELSGGTAEEIADIQLEGLRGAFLIAKSQFEEFALSFADSGLAKDLERLVKVFGNFFEAISNDSALQNLILNFGRLTFLSVGMLKLGSVVGGLAGKLIGLRSALASIQALGGLKDVLGMATSSPAELATSGQGLADAADSIKANKDALRNLAAATVGVAAVVGVGVVAFTYFWDRYKNKLTEVQKLQDEFSTSLKTDLVAGFDGVAAAGAASLAVIKEKILELSTSLSSLQVDRLAFGIEGSDAEFERAVSSIEQFSASGSAARQSVEEIREGFLRAQVEVLAYNVSLGQAIDIEQSFGASADRLVTYLNFVAGATDDAKFSLGDFNKEFATWTFGTSDTNRINAVRADLRELNLELAESGVLLEASREDALETFNNMILGSDQAGGKIAELVDELQKLGNSDITGFQNLDESALGELHGILAEFRDVNYQVDQIDPTNLSSLVSILEEANFQEWTDFAGINIRSEDLVDAGSLEALGAYAAVLQNIKELLAARDLQEAFDLSSVSFETFNTALRENNIDDAVANIEALRSGPITEMPHVFEAVTTSLNTLDEASRALFTEALVDSDALLGLSLADQKKVYRQLIGTLPGYQQEAAQGVLYGMERALSVGVRLPDDFLIKDLSRVLSEAEKTYQEQLAQILEPGENVFDGLVRTFDEAELDVRLLAQFDNVEDALAALSSSPHFATFQEQLNFRGGEDQLLEDFTALKAMVDRADEAALEFRNTLLDLLVPAFGTAFGEAQQKVLADYGTQIEETQDKSKKAALELGLLGESGDDVFTNMEEGLKAVNAELDELLTAAINRVANFDVLEDSGLFTAKEIEVLIEDVIPQLPPGAGDRLLQAVADDLQDGTIDAETTRQLTELVGKKLELDELVVEANWRLNAPDNLFDSLLGLNETLFERLRSEMHLTPEQIVELTSTIGSNIEEGFVVDPEPKMPDHFYEINDVELFASPAEAQAELTRQLEELLSPELFTNTIAEALVLDPTNSSLQAAFVNSKAAMAEGLQFDGDQFAADIDSAVATITPEIETTFNTLGDTSGYNLIIGTIAGMWGHLSLVTSAGRAVGLAAKAGVDWGLENNSPSKAGYRSGAFLVQGIAAGITDSTQLAVEAAKGLAKEIKEVPLEIADVQMQASRITPTFSEPQTANQIDGSIGGVVTGQAARTIHVENLYTPTTTVEGTVALLTEVIQTLEGT